MHHGLVDLHLLDEPLQDLPLCGVVVLNVLVQLLAQRQVLGLHFLVGFPAGVRRHPVLNDARLVARRQVNELAHVFQLVVLFPFVGLHVHGLTFHVRAVNRTLVHVHALQIIHDDGTHAFNDSVVLREFQIRYRDVERFHKITQFNRILALLIQKHVQVELRIVRGVDHVVAANARRHLSDRVHQFLVLVQQLLHHQLLIILMLLILLFKIVQHARHHVLQTQAKVFAVSAGFAQVRQADRHRVAARICAWHLFYDFGWVRINYLRWLVARVI